LIIRRYERVVRKLMMPLLGRRAAATVAIAPARDGVAKDISNDMGPRRRIGEVDCCTGLPLGVLAERTDPRVVVLMPEWLSFLLFRQLPVHHCGIHEGEASDRPKAVRHHKCLALFALVVDHAATERDAACAPAAVKLSARHKRRGGPREFGVAAPVRDQCAEVRRLAFEGVSHGPMAACITMACDMTADNASRNPLIHSALLAVALGLAHIRARENRHLDWAP